MHVGPFLHKLFGNSIHKSRLKTFVLVAETLLHTKQLGLTRLGRALKTKGQERSGIRRVDRLLSNDFFRENSKKVYQKVLHFIVAAKERPIVIVDQSHIPNSTYEILRAALAVQGRALTIYEEVHPKKTASTQKIHQKFLQTLYELMPEGYKPIVVTDAGFKSPWFKKVLKLGWDYVGRVRGKIGYLDNHTQGTVKTLYSLASKTPK